tara:strand:- start:203 stop:757 length:555 start_codon:yes stop_codon:yes gene_type:complete
MTTWNKQIENRNFLSPIGFKFLLAKYPKVDYFCQSASLPGMTLGIQQQPTPFRSLPLEGFLEYEPLTINFLVDENLENYLILHNWIRAMGTPDDTRERRDFRLKMQQLFGNQDLYADATLMVLNSNFQQNFDVVFEDLIPMGLNALEFNASVDGTEYAMAQVQFRYLAYEIRAKDTSVRNKQLE